MFRITIKLNSVALFFLFSLFRITTIGKINDIEYKRASMSIALTFSGQGTHRKGMCKEFVNSSPAAALFDRMKDCMMRNFGVPLQDIIQENPKKVMVRDEALQSQIVCARSCKDILNTMESEPRNCAITHPDGVMSYTYFTQPCVLATQLTSLQQLHSSSSTPPLSSASFIAGHSLGEFTALAALGVFTPEVAVDLTFKRGLLMEDACKGVNRGNWKMYACNPARAQLHDDPETADDLFFIFVEMIAQSLSNTTSFIEVANYNLRHEQYVVAGDLVALSALGKCLDPQFRANVAGSGAPETIVREALIAVGIDKKDGITTNPNFIPNKDFVTSAVKKYGSKSIFRRFMQGPDDGFTPSLEELAHLTLQDYGRSGLMRKTWYIPLSVEIPFHTSRLRRATDQFLPVVRSALPEEGPLRELFSLQSDGTIKTNGRIYPLWVTNLTGKIFNPFDKAFQDDVKDVMLSQNIGEIQHKGRYSSSIVIDAFKEGVKQGSVREICAAVLAAQLSHSVLWIDVMDEIVVANECTRIQEISPCRNVSEMFKRAVFKSCKSKEGTISIQASSYPSENPLF